MSFIFLCLLATLVPKRLVIYCVGIFGIPVYCCLANKLCVRIPLYEKYNKASSRAEDDAKSVEVKTCKVDHQSGLS